MTDFKNETTKSSKDFVVVKSEATTSVPGTKTASTQGFGQSIRETGSFEIEENILKDLKSGGFLPNDAKASDIASAFHLYSMGVKGENLATAARDTAFLREGERNSLYNTAYVIELLEASNAPEIPNLSNVQEENLNPKVMTSESAFAIKPQPNRISFERGDTGLSPILEMGKDKAIGKIKGLATDAIKKGSQRLTKEGSKVLAKAGLKVAAKLGIKGLAQLLGSTVPVIGNVAAFILTEVVPWVFNKLKNIFSGVLRALTGEKDLRKQIAYIAGALALVLFGLGFIGPALVAGLISLGATLAFLGGKVIGVGIGGVFQSFMFAVTTAVVPSIAGPFIIAVIAIPIVTALVIFIINTSAYVVPEGGFGGTIGTIGAPPPGGLPAVSCFALSGDWPAGESNNLSIAMNTLVNNFPAYINKVCSGSSSTNPINLCYDPPHVSSWGFHWHDWPGGCDLLFSSGGLTNSIDATYILAHELGHHLQNISGIYFQMYLDYPGTQAELPLCSYSATSYPSEGFAESIALYVKIPTFWSLADRCGNTTFPTKYPASWQFVNDIIMLP